MVNWPSTKFSSLNFIGKTLACIGRRAEYLVILDRKQNHENAGFVTSSKFSYMSQKFVRTR